MWSIFKSKPKSEPVTKEPISTSFSPSKTVDGTTVPDGWYVHEAGQSPVHMLWGVTLVNFDTMFGDGPVQSSSVDEYDTLGEAIQAAIAEIK
jgi:hypothetical protein